MMVPEFTDSVVTSLIVFFLVNGGASLAGFGFIEFLGRKWEAFGNLDKDYKRYASIVLSVLVAWAVYGVALWLNVYPVPETSQEWFTMLVAVGSTVFTGTQIVHGVVDLRPESRG